jgi:hypothetical protein
MDTTLLALATTHVGDMIRLALEHTSAHKALVVYDTQNELTNILTAAYRANLPDATFIDFDKTSREDVIAAFDTMAPGDLVVLIQSSNFRLNEFRIRLHLFSKKLKVIEHMHLYRNTPDVWDVYINSLAYDINWYRNVGPKLKAKLEPVKKLRIQAMGQELCINGGLETPKLNIGDYKGMENIGGTFPIGEVFTEALDFSTMNGSFMIYAFAGAEFTVDMHEPFRVDIKEGQVVGWSENTPKNFIEIVGAIKAEERAVIREIGFGLNRAITRQRYVQDITAFERILGMHLSLGEKHSVYKKEGIITAKARFHVDLFPVVDKVIADDTVIFENGQYIV